MVSRHAHFILAQSLKEAMIALNRVLPLSKAASFSLTITYCLSACSSQGKRLHVIGNVSHQVWGFQVPT